MKKSGIQLIFLTALVAFMSGCSVKSGEKDEVSGANVSSKEASQKESANAELLANPSKPVTIKIFQQYAGLSDLDFTTMMKEPVEKKFPNITLELVRATSKIGPQELLVSGDFPDIIFTSSQNMNDFMNLQLPYDLNSFVSKNKMDLNKFEPASITEIKSFGDKGELYALPFSLNFGLLFYNKTIFDQAAVSYPKDNMTWEQVVDLAKQVGGKVGDKYSAFDPNPITRLSISWMLPKIDPKTNRAAFTTDSWKQLYEMYYSIHKIPGNQKYGNEGNRFYKDQNVAMIISYGGLLGYLEQEAQQGKDANYWDVVTFPQRSNAPKGIETEVRLLMMSSSSKQKEEALKVMNYLTSDEVQTIVSRQAQRSSLTNNKTKESFGVDFASLKGKNIQAIFKQQYNPNPKPTKFDNAVKPPLFDAFKRMLQENTDANTALRKAEEEANKIIDSMMK